MDSIPCLSPAHRIPAGIVVWSFSFFMNWELQILSLVSSGKRWPCLLAGWNAPCENTQCGDGEISRLLSRTPQQPFVTSWRDRSFSNLSCVQRLQRVRFAMKNDGLTCFHDEILVVKIANVWTKRSLDCYFATVCDHFGVSVEFVDRVFSIWTVELEGRWVV